MSQQEKDSLENFFRERTQRHNLEFNEGDWLKLEKQLDREMPVAFTFFSFLKRFWIVTLVLLLVPLIWISYYSSTNSKTDIPLKIDNDSGIISPDADDRVLVEEKGIKSQLESNSTSENLTSSDNYHAAGEQNIKSANADDSFDNAGSLSVLMEGALPKIQNDSEKEIVSEQKHEESKNLGQVVFGKGAKSGIYTMDQKLLFLSAIPPYFAIEEAFLGAPSNVLTENEISPIKIKRSFFKVGVGYSPDFSTVGIGNFVSPGSRWTVMVEYGFLNRVAVNTGVALVDNKYEAYGEDYHAPAKYWKKGIVADEAYGECKMIDIPLNIRYNVFSKNKNSVFVSAGASTYFVLKEDYYFHYENQDPELPDHWGTEKMTIYPFGIINISAGYEYQFSKKSGIQIEPFIKIPTTGIGWGNVDLHTIGVYFMYKYKLTK